jgi:hypothetical protein
MNERKRLFTLLIAGVLSVAAIGLAFADDDEEGEDEGKEREGMMMESRMPIRQVTNPTYNKECGSCHMAYQPGLLPTRAWAQIMTPAALSNHYGDDASLSEELRKEISAVLGIDSPDLALQGNPLAQGADAAAGELPRISTTASFRQEHDEIPARLVKDNPKVGSLSQCNACHRGAADGDYNERGINIPGYGPWRD